MMPNSLERVRLRTDLENLCHLTETLARSHEIPRLTGATVSLHVDAVVPAMMDLIALSLTLGVPIIVEARPVFPEDLDHWQVEWRRAK